MTATVVRGVQEPRIMSIPDYASSAGEEAVELCALAGLELDPWQQIVLSHSVGEVKNGKWAAFEVGLCGPRQNGKDGVLEGRELAGLFLLGERLIIHSAHQFDTSLEHFRRLLFLIENTPEFDKRVQRVVRSHGEEGIELKGGQRIRFRTRTKGGGRGFSGDLLLLNEAMIIPESSHGALLPTLSARPNPQVWYAGSAVDRFVHDDGVVFARVRERGLKGDDGLAYFEWSADVATPDEVTDGIAEDRDLWAQANPGLGIRISEQHVAHELASMDRRTFVVERLGIGDWPRVDGMHDTAISVPAWNALIDETSKITSGLCLAFDVSPDRAWSTITAAGKRADGLAHVEVIDRKKGTGWVVDRLAELVEAHEPAAVGCDASGPAGSLLPELEDEGVDVTPVSAKEHGQACGRLADLVEQKAIRHLGSPEIVSSLKGATTRPLGDAWAWSRKNSSVDITPLVAATLALWCSSTAKQKRSWRPVEEPVAA